MTQILQNSRRPASLRAGVSASTLMFLPLAVMAAENAPENAPVKQLPTVKVQDTAIDPNPNAQLGVPYKAKTSGDDRHTRPLAETPQTISVLTKAQIDDSGYTDLAKILNAQPGVSVGTGENGNAFGDRYIIRGQEARSDVFVDGLRDPGMTIRESFAVDQVEISKGPNSSFAGRGTAGGAINAITKQATTAMDFAKISPAFGTDDFTRVTVDANQSFGEQFAVRANALYHYQEVPDRAPADRERKGLALSGLYAPSENLSVVLDYYGLRADDNPDLGSYLTGTVPNRVPKTGVPAYVQEPDFLKSDVDTGTLRIKYSIAPTLRVSNLTRYGESNNGYVVTGANGATANANNPGGAYATATLSTHQGWQDVEYLANQTNLYWDKTLFGREHAFIFGVEYTDHSVLNGVYSVSNSGQNCSTGNSTTFNAFCFIGRDGRAVNGLNTMMNRQIAKGNWDQDWQVKTISVAVMDTFDLNDSWTLFAGLRSDHFDFDLVTQNTNTLVSTAYSYSDSLLDGQLGLTYKIDPDLIVYASASTASDINGGESDVGTSSSYGGAVVFNGRIAGAKPERSLNLEVGTKWNVFDESLLLTAALFRTTKSDVMEGDAGYAATGTFNTGKSRVQGIELGVSGMLLEGLTAQAGVAFMESEILESTTAANVGKTMTNFADASASAQLKYQLTESLAIGVAGKHEGKKYGGQPDRAASYNAAGLYSQPIPGYTIADVFANYRFNEKFEMRLNVGNVTDKDYYLAVYQSGAFLYKGDARTVRLTFNYDL
ncbi:TonB-dependent receptor [Steroidobacter sp.]|uniref:TonB-dependent receptor n=1 Tax=Steroidobacter sp. TaxID=1978227 RepID=UPI001A635F80|nr:TonB-dependent receptor [Steroidobacter sp.]MBL8267878.1 TonB-dependent receptor [Steroidobacter sp.]